MLLYSSSSEEKTLRLGLGTGAEAQRAFLIQLDRKPFSVPIHCHGCETRVSNDKKLLKSNRHKDNPC